MSLRGFFGRGRRDDIAALTERVSAIESEIAEDMARLGRRDEVVAADRARIWATINRRWDLLGESRAEHGDRVNALESRLDAELLRLARRDKVVAADRSKIWRSVHGNREIAAQSISRTTSQLRRDLLASTKRIEKLERELRLRLRFNDLKHINKEAVEAEIELARESGVAQSGRPSRLIVSLTSTPWRMYDLHYTLHSLLAQSLKPDKVVLWLGRELFPRGDADVPQAVLALRERGLEIEYCHDVRSYTKLVPALAMYPEDTIVTADDDIYYERDWLERLFIRHDSVSGLHITSALSRRVTLDGDGVELYSRWPLVGGGAPAVGLLPMGVAGVVYPPHSLHPEVMDEDMFLALAPSADDLWLWAMAARAGTPILPGLASSEERADATPFLKGVSQTFVNPQRELRLSGEATLGAINVDDANNTILATLLDRWPKLYERLIPENPYVSVVVLAHGQASSLRSCLDALLAQTLHNIEIIVVMDLVASNGVIGLLSAEYARQDSRVRVVGEGEGISELLSAGVRESTGTYLAFFDSCSSVRPDHLQRLFFAASREGRLVARGQVSRVVGGATIAHTGNAAIKARFDESNLLAPLEAPLLVEGALFSRGLLVSDSADVCDVSGRWPLPELDLAVRLFEESIGAVPVPSASYQQREGNLLSEALDSVRACRSRCLGYESAVLKLGKQHESRVRERILRRLLNEWYEVVEVAVGKAVPNVDDVVVDEMLERFVAQAQRMDAAEPAWSALLSATTVGAYRQHKADSSFLATVVVPVHNNEVEIAQWVRGLKSNATAARMEAIFLDLGSDDHSLAMLEQLARESANVRVVSLDGGAPTDEASVLRFAATVARSPFMLLGSVDVDVVVEWDALGRIAAIAADDALEVAIALPTRDRPGPSAPWDWRHMPPPTRVADLKENVGLLLAAELGIGTALIGVDMLKRVLSRDDTAAATNRQVMHQLLQQARGISFRSDIALYDAPVQAAVLNVATLSERLNGIVELGQMYRAYDRESLWPGVLEQLTVRLFGWIADAETSGSVFEFDAEGVLEPFYEMCDSLDISYELVSIRRAFVWALRNRGVTVTLALDVADEVWSEAEGES